MLELVVPQHIKYVALILLLAYGFQQAILTVATPNPSVVTGDKLVTSKLLHLLHEDLELDVAIALNARVWRSPLRVLIHKVIDD